MPCDVVEVERYWLPTTPLAHHSSYRPRQFCISDSSTYTSFTPVCARITAWGFPKPPLPLRYIQKYGVLGQQVQGMLE